MHDQYLQILKKVGLFSELHGNEKALTYIKEQMTFKQFPVGHTLIQQGAKGTELYVMVEGQVSIFKKTPEGDAYKVAVLNGNSAPAFGEGGLMEGEVRSATIVCDTEVSCFILTREVFNIIGEIHPEFAFPIIKKIASNLMKTLGQTSHDLMLLHQALMNEIRSN
ncbi:MAG: cyclic nucleotide-binding domain-containing protein [Bdellovibrionota bacterium]